MSEIDRQQMRVPAILALANGSVFSGYSRGAMGHTVGEVVFNTSMTGYQEIITDPSYAEQIVTLTYPHIGNVGVNPDDCESGRAWVAGLIVREISPIVSNWRATQSLDDYLKAQNIVAIEGIDTRRLTRIIREQGAQNGCIMSGTTDATAALQHARAYAGLQGKDLAKVVSTTEISRWEQGTLKLTAPVESQAKHRFHVVVYDFGIKQQILRLLVDQGCHVTVVPAQTSVEQVMALKPDGVAMSNGPGDPAACGYAIEFIRQYLERNVPFFGICLGFQLLALACGGKTFKMKFGHHGANHPVQNIATGRVFITSQNHGFAVDETCLPESLRITHRSLFDGTLQGMAHKTKLAIAFQGHPEASPGPHDVCEMFAEFIKLMASADKKAFLLDGAGH
jgi:carbamoyl-phosphate synthase small subunit